MFNVQLREQLLAAGLKPAVKKLKRRDWNEDQTEGEDLVPEDVKRELEKIFSEK